VKTEPPNQSTAEKSVGSGKVVVEAGAVEETAVLVVVGPGEVAVPVVAVVPGVGTPLHEEKCGRRGPLRAEQEWLEEASRRQRSCAPPSKWNVSASKTSPSDPSSSWQARASTTPACSNTDPPG
jgi:hypothetical protein